MKRKNAKRRKIDDIDRDHVIARKENAPERGDARDPAIEKVLFSLVFFRYQTLVDKRRRKRSVDSGDIKTEPSASSSNDKPKYFDEIEREEQLTTDVTLQGEFEYLYHDNSII